MTGAGLIRGAAQHIGALRSGEPVTPEQADSIIKAYKYGGLGLLAMYLGTSQHNWLKTGGFYSQGAEPNRDETGKPMEFSGLRIAGHDVPHLLAHNPFIEAVQFWATMRRGWDQARQTHDIEHQAGEAMRQGVGGLLKEAPGLESTAETASALAGDKNAGKTLGAYARGNLVPSIVQEAAKGRLPGQQFLPGPLKGDVDAQGKTIPRKSETIKEGIQEGIPGLRQRLPVRGAGSTKGVGTSTRLPNMGELIRGGL
jgi:hypothetical protein